MFGIANQLLAAIALSVGTTVILRSGRTLAALSTSIPLAFVSFTTIDAGVLSIRDNFLPMARTPGKAFTGWLDAILTAVLIACTLSVLASSLRVWKRLLWRSGVTPGAGALAGPVPSPEPAGKPQMPDGCC